MKQTPATASDDNSEEIIALVRTLHDTQQRLKELTRGQVDAVMHQDGQSYLLHEAQGRLRESENNQRRLADTMGAILNALPAHIALLDTNGVIISVNESWRLFALFQGSEDDNHGLNQNYLEICDHTTGPGAEDAHATAAGIRAVLSGAIPEFSLEYPCDTAEKKLWFQVIIAPVGEGRPGGVVVMHIDITERKMADEALRASAASLAVSQSIAHLGSWEVELTDSLDFRKGRHRGSDEMYRILGYEPQSFEMTSELLFKNIPPEYHALVERELTALIQDRQEHDFVHPIIRPTGEQRIILSVAQVHVDEKTGRPTRIIGTAQDITETKKAEEQLLAQAALLEAQMQSTLDGILVVGSDGKKLLQNQRMIDLWMIPPEIANDEDRNRRVDWFTRQVKYPEQFTEKVQHLIEHPDETSQDELELLDGRFLDRYSAPVLGDDGKYYGRIWVHRDITERKMADEALRRSAVSLATSQSIAHLGSWEVELTDSLDFRTGRHRGSDEMYRILGYEPQSFEMTFELLFKNIPPEYHALVERELTALIQDRQEHDFVHPIIRPTGEQRIILSVAQVQVDEKTGQPVRIIGTAQDITETKKAEEQLLAQAALLEAQMQSTLDGILVVDSNGKKILQNQKMIDLWKIPPEIANEIDDQRQLEWVTSQIKNQGPFSERVADYYSHPEEIGQDELELLDGRFFDRYSAPVRGRDGKYHGRIWVFRDSTERKLAEGHLVKQVELLNMASRVGKLGVWALEFPGPRLVWSEEVYRLHEVEPDYQPTFDSALNFYPDSSRQTLAAAIASKQPYDLELDFITAKGKKLWVRTTSAVEMENGEVRRLYGIFQDLTDRKKGEARLRRLIDSDVQGVFFWNTQGEIIEANDAFLHMVGYSREDLRAGRVSWKTMTAPEYEELDRQALEDLAARGTSKAYEKAFIRKDGSSIPILLGSATFEDRSDEGVCFVLDLTERKRTESRFRRLVDSNVQGVIFWNAHGEVTYANDAFLNLVGYSREDLEAGRINWKEITPLEYAEIDQQALNETTLQGFSTPYEKEYIRKDGTRIPVLIGSAAFEDNREEGVRFVLDLTERKKIERQFLRAQRMESIGTLAGGIAHDLNNILAPILMAVQILKLSATDPQAKSILETIEVSSKRGADIVRQVLSFARGVEGERLEIQPKHLLKDIETIIKDTFPKNIQRNFSIPEDCWTILGDPTQLHQILLNLCVNARDAMPDGGNLNVTAENAVLDEQYSTMNIEAKPGRYVALNVTDTGMGIPSGILDKIFDPFFTTKEIGKGTGLGLSTVLAIVKSHAGFINVYSEVGKGTNFKVYLPALEGAPKLRKNSGALASLSRGKGETILIIDDEASILTITSQTLQAFGYRTLTANDGAEGVATYAQNQDLIAAVLTDMAMPIMDGLATIRALIKINPAVKIIAATGLKTDGSDAKISETGAKYSLAKPYTAGTLLKTLRALLDEAPPAK